MLLREERQGRSKPADRGSHNPRLAFLLRGLRPRGLHSHRGGRPRRVADYPNILSGYPQVNRGIHSNSRGTRLTSGYYDVYVVLTVPIRDDTGAFGGKALCYLLKYR